MIGIIKNNRDNSSSSETNLPFGHALRYRLSVLKCHINEIGKQAKRLGTWLEVVVFPAARQDQHDHISLTLQPQGIFRIQRDIPNITAELSDCRQLCNFLLQLDLSQLELETRLESNQIVDVLMLLYTYRRNFASQSGAPKTSIGPCPCGRIFTEPGLHFCCAQIRIHQHILEIKYSYCVTSLSRIVRWFEQKHRHFNDHRALFHAAPRYGLMAALLVQLCPLAFVFTSNTNLLIAAAFLESGIIFAVIYVFFSSMGSIEYDNEEKAYRLHRAYAILDRYNQRIRHDLSLASAVQQKLLPDASRMPLNNRLDWASSFVPATEVGGDYFDTALRNDGKVAMVFADVSGHGMAAALITVILKTTFQRWVEEQLSLTDFVRRVNSNLYRFTPDGSFVVLIAALYDIREHCFHFINCGHSPPPIHLPGDTVKPVRFMTETGAMLLGVVEDIEIQTPQQLLTGGDKILMATDGITEAKDNQGGFYGQERLENLIRRNRTLSPAKLVDSVIDDVAAFAKGAEQSDDRTMLAFQLKST